MKLSEECIFEELINIFKYRTKIDFKINNNLKDKKLLGKDLQVPVRELVLILYDIESKFNINIPKEEVIKGNFNSFEKIYNIVRTLT